MWSRPVDSAYLILWNAEEIAGSGYYRVPHREWTGTSYAPNKLAEFTRGDRHVALLALAKNRLKRPWDDEKEAWWNDITSA